MTNLFVLTALELLGEPNRPGLRGRPGVDEQRLQAILVAGLIGGQRGIVRPDRTVFVAIRLIAPHFAGIGTTAGTLIYLPLLAGSQRFAPPDAPGISLGRASAEGKNDG